MGRPKSHKYRKRQYPRKKPARSQRARRKREHAEKEKLESFIRMKQGLSQPSTSVESCLNLELQNENASSAISSSQGNSEINLSAVYPHQENSEINLCEAYSTEVDGALPVIAAVSGKYYFDAEKSSGKDKTTPQSFDVNSIKIEPLDEEEIQMVEDNGEKNKDSRKDRFTRVKIEQCYGIEEINAVNGNLNCEKESDCISSSETSNFVCQDFEQNKHSASCFEEYKLLSKVLKYLTTSVLEDKFTLTGKLYAMKVRSIPDMQQLFAEKLIDKIFSEAELGLLDNNTIITNKSNSLIESNSQSSNITPSFFNLNSSSEKNFFSKNQNFCTSSQKKSNNFINSFGLKSCLCLEKKVIFDDLKKCLQKNKQDKFDILGDFYAAKMRALPRHQCFYAEKLFYEVLLEGEFDLLNQNTCLSRSISSNNQNASNKNLRPRNEPLVQNNLSSTSSARHILHESDNLPLETLVTSAELLLKPSKRRISQRLKQNSTFSVSTMLDSPIYYPKRTYSKKSRTHLSDSFQENELPPSNPFSKHLGIASVKDPSVLLPVSSDYSSIPPNSLINSFSVTSSSNVSSTQSIPETNQEQSSSSLDKELGSSSLDKELGSSSVGQQSLPSANSQISFLSSTSASSVNEELKSSLSGDIQFDSNVCLTTCTSTISAINTNASLSVPSQIPTVNSHLQMLTSYANSTPNFSSALSLQPFQSNHPNTLPVMNPAVQNVCRTTVTSALSTENTIVSLPMPSQLPLVNAPVQVLTSYTNSVNSFHSALPHPSPSSYLFPLHQAPTYSVPMPVLRGRHPAPIQYVTYEPNPYIMQPPPYSRRM